MLLHIPEHFVNFVKTIKGSLHNSHTPLLFIRLKHGR